MVNIKMKLWGQLKKVAKVATIDLKTESKDLEGIIKDLTKIQNAELAKLLLNDDGSCRHSILGFENDVQIDWNKELNIKDGDIISLMSPIAGG